MIKIRLFYLHFTLGPVSYQSWWELIKAHSSRLIFTQLGNQQKINNSSSSFTKLLSLLSEPLPASGNIPGNISPPVASPSFWVAESCFLPARNPSKPILIYCKCSPGSGEHTQLRIHLQRHHLGKSTGWCEEMVDWMEKSFLGHVFLLKTKVCFQHPWEKDLTELRSGPGVPGGTRQALGALFQAVQTCPCSPVSLLGLGQAMLPAVAMHPWGKY